MEKSNKKGFTLVELLAVIVILAIILVIAVPKIMSTINQSKTGSMESSAKLAAKAVERAYEISLASGEAKTLSRTGSCMEIANLDTNEYETCTYEIGTNEKATVTLSGTSNGKFSGLVCIDATTKEATCKAGELIPKAVAFSTDTWETIVNAVKTNKVGAYHVGDEKEITLKDIGTFTVRIANMSTPAECLNNTFSQSACGFVIEFVDIISKQQMNTSATNVGGWPATNVMYAYLNTTIFNALPEIVQEGIKLTKTISGHGKTSGETTNFESTDKLYLLSAHEVWVDETDNKVSSYDTSYNSTRQLDYYAGLGVTTNNKSGVIKQYKGSNTFWWLRSSASSTTSSFLGAVNVGSWSFSSGNDTGGGVAPAFRIGTN